MDVFALLSFAVTIFPLFSVLRRAIQHRVLPLHVALTLALVLISMALLMHIVASMKLVVLYAGFLVTLTFGVPALLVWSQRMKHEVRGPWDEARIGQR
jgi:phosphatidylinositol N-acetylglucosaminyltransferase subunit C